MCPKLQVISLFNHITSLIFFNIIYRFIYLLLDTHGKKTRKIIKHSVYYEVHKEFHIFHVDYEVI